MSSKVYVTGLGIVSALGIGVEENLGALKEAKTGIDYPQYLETNHKTSFVVGEVKYSNRELADKIGIKDQKKISRTALLGLIAAREAVLAAGLDISTLKGASLLNGTSVGGMDISELHYKPLVDGIDFDYKQAFAGHDCGASTEFIASHLNINGFLSTISTACSSSANTIMHAGRLIKARKADCIIAGGTDALSVFTLNGFNALKILDPNHCKPFDLNRVGLNLGEGAAYLVLESEDQVKKYNRKVLGQLVGYGNANDAYHQTASSPEGKGAYLAMKKAFEMTGRDTLSVDYINAHGTGTNNNDLSESTALKMMFGERIPDYSSTKSFTGHTLGAAGGIEAVFSMLSLINNLKYPNLNIDQPMDLLSKSPLTALVTEQKVNCVVSNSFGFGGNCSSLIFTE